MKACQFHFLSILVIASTLLITGFPVLTIAADPPSLAVVKSVVEQHLRTIRDYSPGDLISRGDVEAIFNELIDRGFPVNDIAEGLYDDFVPENSFLIQALHTEAGRKFMRKVNSLPFAYDRLERLSWIPAGQDILRELIDKPDGAALFKTMLEPSGMKATIRHLESDPRGKNYAFPTGHIHTAEELLKHLEEKYPEAKNAK